MESASPNLLRQPVSADLDNFALQIFGIGAAVRVDAGALGGEETLRINARGCVHADPKTLETTVPGVFAAGDLVRGPSLVVWALKDALTASESIARHLEDMIEVAA